MKDGQVEFQIEKSSGEITINKHEYHGRSINVIGIEHHELFDTKMPDNWQERIGDVMDSNPNSTVFLEYAVPDLKRHLLAEPGVNILAGIWLKDENILDFFGEVGRMAGERGMRIAVADPASNSVYALAEFNDERKWKIKLKERNGDFVPMSGHNTPISEMEMTTPNAVDARRLLSSMAVMQHCREEDSDVIIISPPAHTERINNYIGRQIEAESKGEDANKNDKDKLLVYLKNKLFNTNIRYYVPNTFPEFFKLDGIVGKKNYQEAQQLIDKINQERPSIRGKIISHLLRLTSSEGKGMLSKSAERLLEKYASTFGNWELEKKSKIKAGTQNTDHRE